jgi:HAE1 family hydrophobic/amphiphilic exporter-1
VFVPVAFMGGMIGRFFYQFGITVGFAVLVSLFVSFTIDPMMSSRWYDPAADPSVRRSWFARKLQFLNDQLDRLREIVGWTLGFSLRHRWVVVLVTIAAVVSSIALFARLGSAFMPEADEGQFRVRYKAAPEVSLERSSEIARELIREVRANPAVAYTYTTIGGEYRPINEGSIFVRLTEREKREHMLDIMADMRTQMARFRGIRTSVGSADESAGETKPIQISVRGPELARVNALGDAVMKIVSGIDGAMDVDTSEEQPRPEVRVALDRKSASDLGLDVGTVASTVRGLIAGEVVSKFEDADGDSYDVRLRVDPSHRARSTDLLSLDLPGRGGAALIALNQVARIENGAAPSNIRRRDLVREVRISASTQGRSLGEIIADVQTRTAGLHLPAGYSIGYTGDYEIMIESFGYAVNALGLAIVLIYAILASQFRSFLQPLAIMLSLPLSLLGVAGMLYLAGDTLNMMSVIGVILLMGLVTKNAILLVDFANVQRREGLARYDALRTAAKVRLRPILMTTLAMIFGMLPLAFEWGAGAEFRAPMARAVIGGLITSTLLTLIVVPVVYTFLDDIGALAARWWRRETPVPAAEAMPAANIH